MTLSDEERARVSDSKHNIQAAAVSLSKVDLKKVPDGQEVVECLEKADKTLRAALQARTGQSPSRSGSKESLK